MSRTDARGRWYVEVRPFASDDQVRAALAACAELCVECGARIVHGVTPYFQRHDPIARRRELREHPERARTLAILLFDVVCVACTDDAIPE
jgi:hypothetical protein